MIFPRKKILLSLYLLYATLVYGQLPYLQHITPPLDEIENENFAIVQHTDGSIYVANSEGLLAYDGKSWEIIKTPGTVLSLHSSAEGILWIGCINNIGYLYKEKNGKLEYKSIYKSNQNLIAISQIISNQEFIYFKGEDFLAIIDPKSIKILSLQESKGVDMPDYIFKTQKDVFGLFEKGKVSILRGNKFVHAYTITIPGFVPVAFTPISDNQVVLAGSDGDLILADDKSWKILNLTAASYLKQAKVNSLQQLSDQLIAVGTNKGGCVVLDIKKNAIVEIMNFYTGLPDDEIFALGYDNQGGLWMAHEFGFSRWQVQAPLSEYTAYAGWDGHVESFVVYQETPYLATSEGLYCLKKSENVSSLKKLFVDRTAKAAKEEEKSGKLNVVISEQKSKYEGVKRFFFFNKKKSKDTVYSAMSEKIKAGDESKKKKSFLGLFTKNKATKSTSNSNAEINSKQAISKEKTKPTHTSKTSNTKIISTPKISVIDPISEISLKNNFVKVENISGKIKFLIQTNEGFYAAGEEGLFEVNGTKSSRKTNHHIIYAFYDEKSHAIIYSTFQHTVHVYDLKSKSVVFTLEQFHERIENMILTRSNELYLGSSHTIYRFRYDTQLKKMSPKDTFLLENPFTESIVLVPYKSSCMLLHQGSTWHPIGKIFRSDTTTGALKYKKVIHSQYGITWIFNGEKWYKWSDNNPITTLNPWASVCKDIQEIIEIEPRLGKIILLTKSNRIVEISDKKSIYLTSYNTVKIKEVIGQGGDRLPLDQIELTQNKSFIQFSVFKPEFLDHSALQYQFKLDGLMNDWSPWQYSNMIAFNYIPNGDYTLLVRSKNVLDEISESTPFSVKVTPPYWQQWWFFLLEFVVFGSLLFGSFFLNRTQGNLWLTRILTVVTIVMLIEFVDTIAESYIPVDNSPVISFVVQVFIALLILPFEKLLSSFIKKS